MVDVKKCQDLWKPHKTLRIVCLQPIGFHLLIRCFPLGLYCSQFSRPNASQRATNRKTTRHSSHFPCIRTILCLGNRLRNKLKQCDERPNASAAPFPQGFSSSLQKEKSVSLRCSTLWQHFLEFVIMVCLLLFLRHQVQGSQWACCNGVTGPLIKWNQSICYLH